jgi:DNA repair exonuclease SbcCD ATPase subunit
MRYKDENIINFSVDNEKNVTVVLGDNTFGKTTIAQAFRWGLYGTIIDTRYSKAADVSLLNNDVLADMTANSRKNVIVEISIVNENTEYEIIRNATYIRKYPHYIAVKKSESLMMRTKIDGKWTDYINNDDSKTRGSVEERIQMMFPKELSSYFFFDGERWGQEKNTKNDIKDSIGTIMGTKALEKMKLHLKEQSKNNVISMVQKKMIINDDSAEKLTKQKEGLEEKIDHTLKDIKDNEEQAEYYCNEYLKIKEVLEKNSRVEDLQKQVELLEKMIEASSRRQKGYYESIIKSFSDSYMFFTTPLLERAVNILKNVDLEGKDIPDVSDKTIDYLIEHKRCLCGHEVCENSSEWMHLQRLKDVIPPKAIGTIVGLFQSKMYEWETKGKDIFDSIKENAESMDSEYIDMEDQVQQRDDINKSIDRTINFAEQRKKMNNYDRNKQILQDKNRIFRQNIDEYQKSIQTIDEKLKEVGTHNAENLRYQRIISYAEALYKFTC